MNAMFVIAITARVNIFAKLLIIIKMITVQYV